MACAVSKLPTDATSFNYFHGFAASLGADRRQQTLLQGRYGITRRSFVQRSIRALRQLDEVPQQGFGLIVQALIVISNIQKLLTKLVKSLDELLRPNRSW